MCLVEIPALESYRRPVLRRPRLLGANHALKPQHALEHLWLEAHSLVERRDQVPVGDAQVPRERSDRAPAAYLGSPNSDPALTVERADSDEDEHDRLTEALGHLDERSRAILARRWLTDDKATLHELAAEYDVSAERIRQIEANAIAKLRAKLVAA